MGFYFPKHCILKQLLLRHFQYHSLQKYFWNKCLRELITWSESIIFVPQTLNYLCTNSSWDSKTSFLELGLVEPCRLGDIYGFPKTGWAEIDIMVYFCSSNRWDFCDHFIVPLSKTCHLTACLVSFEQTISSAPHFSCPLYVMPACNPLNSARFYFTPVFLFFLSSLEAFLCWWEF